MRRGSWLPWLTAAVALGASLATVVLSSPLSWIVPLCAVCVIALLMERMVATFDQKTRRLRERSRKR